MSSNHSSQGPLVSKGLLLSLLFVFFTISAVWLYVGKYCSPYSNTNNGDHEAKTEVKAGH